MTLQSADMNEQAIATGVTDAVPLPDLHDRIMEAYLGQLGKEFAQSTRERIHWICARATGMRILDVGCSQGITSILLGRERRSVIALDISKRSIDEARQFIAREPSHVQKSVKFIHGDFIGTDFGAETFDTVIMSEVLEHLTKPDEFISAAVRLLNEDGTLIVTVPFGVNDWPDHKHTFYLLAPWRLLSTHFDIKEVKFFGKWIGFTGRKRDEARDLDEMPPEALLLEVEQAFQQVERDLITKSGTLTAKINKLKTRLQAVSDQNDTLIDTISQAEIIQLFAEERIAALNAEIDLHRSKDAEIADNADLLEDSLQKAKLEKAASTQDIARLSAEHAALETLTERFRREAEQLAGTLETERRERLVAEKKVILAEGRLEAVETLLKEATERLAAQTNETNIATGRLKQLRAERDDQDQEITRLSGELEEALAIVSQGKAEIELFAKLQESERFQRRVLESKIGELQIELTGKDEKIASLSSSLTDAEHSLLRLRTDAVQRKLVHDQTQKELEIERGLHQATSGRLEAAQLDIRSGAIRHEELQRQVQRSSAHIMMLQNKVDAAERARVLAEAKTLRTRNMISFQLGFALIQASKSWQGLALLPQRLRDISKDARRRAKGDLKPARLVPAAPKLPSITFEKTGYSAQQLKALKIACIMDDFTYASYENEAVLLQLTPADWREQLEAFLPEILFVESAWRGKDELWGNQVGHRSNHLVELVEWCRHRKIPTVFWNKEDPVHYETFLNTAVLFDHVFTTDIDCIGRYKAALGHDNVWLLPFACPTNRFNPIETYAREQAFSFAGAYYARYPERNGDLASIISALAENHKVAIYDRNYGQDDPRYQFPPEFQPFIVGHLPYDQIERAYKAYTHAINMNSIKQSQSMFARRVYELLGSNTVTISNFSRGVRNLFGDLVICSDNGAEIIRRLDGIADETTARKFRLAGLRKVLSEHTMQDRLAYVASKALRTQPAQLLPDILVVAYADDREAFDRIRASFQRQAYRQKRLLVITNGFEVEPQEKDIVHVVDSARLLETRFTSFAGSARYIAGMIAADYYGPNYLTDLALATRYFDGEAIGKRDHYYAQDSADGISLSDTGQRYRPGKTVMAKAALIAVSVIENEAVCDWIAGLHQKVITVDRALFIDEFNYCENGTSATETALKLVDDAGFDMGLSMESLIAHAEAIKPDAMPAGADSAIAAPELAGLFKTTGSECLALAVEGQSWHMSSTLPDGKHEYVYAAKELEPATLGFSGIAKFHLETTPGLNVQCVMIYLDAKKQKLSHEIFHANQNATCTLPEGAALIRIGLRLYGPGTTEVKRLFKGHKAMVPGTLLGKARHLVLTNHYPRYDDLYRNGFVHSRVKHYFKHGVPVDVFRFQTSSALGYHEFEDVDVTTGGAEALDKLISDRQFESVAVHFLDPAMWQVLERHIDRVRVNVWIHGAEIQPWHRREFNFRNDMERQAEKAKSQQRLEFWQTLLAKQHHNLHIIFVSKTFSEEVMEDLGFRLAEWRYSIIHNPIDTELFAYRKKDISHRQRILSIRTYASKKYANDLSVGAILALKDEPFFSALEFRLIGDGQLFDEETEPLQGFKNVFLEKRFVSHTEIVALQENYGVFLTPTRWDSQGVSRDEAMSSGLVPVTTGISAIPEFLDETCGYLAKPEDAAGLATAIADLYKHPQKFLDMSKAAAKRVRNQSSADEIIRQELTLICGLHAEVSS